LSLILVEGPNIREFRIYKRFKRVAKKADYPMKMGADRRKEGWNPE